MTPAPETPAITQTANAGGITCIDWIDALGAERREAIAAQECAIRAKDFKIYYIMRDYIIAIDNVLESKRRCASIIDQAQRGDEA